MNEIQLEYTDSVGAMQILNIKSHTTLRKYEEQGYIRAVRPFGSNRKKFKIVELERAIKKG
ncbi:hypothetical protein ACFPVY_13520 [Flavobacterium qiangtangense]|uniref:HTH merR-type domain-containing protein n=1 Tax=Flavobacterium qiangtangense TaxID=1442595 RepID=A0ABW1PRZ9_9FLAO